jgi:hypothetical protein
MKYSNPKALWNPCVTMTEMWQYILICIQEAANSKPNRKGYPGRFFFFCGVPPISEKLK